MINEKYMSLALSLAGAALGQTSPNPVVGAVVVKDGLIVGTGAHLRAGSAHAEVIAIDMAKEHAIGATLYTTLEPCCHYGKTAPCTKYIINNQIKKVVIATLDPNAKVSGQGVTELQNAGIEVEVGLLKDQATEINKIFFHYITHQIPYITIKAGMSLDAKLATSTFESKWITNAKARDDAHYYRNIHDAILIGVDSVIMDNPSLTTRLNSDDNNHSLRIVLDTHLRTPCTAQIVTDKKSHTFIITGCNADINNEKAKAYNKDFVTILKMGTPKIELKPLMQILAKQQISSILVEGGGKIISSFIEDNLFNQLILYISPILIGNNNAPSLFAGTGFLKLSEATTLKFQHIEQLDDNLKIVASNPKYSVTGANL